MATQIQSEVGGSLADLGLKSVPSTDGTVGGSQNYEITDECIEKLTAAKAAGKNLVLGSNGTFSIEK